MTGVVIDLAPGKGARTRQTLLDQAIAHFAAVGRRGASVATIARAAGITPSAAYVYFPSKQALYEAAVDADTAGLLADALPELMAGHFDGNFGRVLGRLLRSLPAHPLAHRILSGLEGAGPERLKVLPAEMRLHAGLTRALRQGQADGTVRDDIDPEIFAAGIEAIVIALIIAVLQTGGEVQPAESAGVLAVLDAALRPPR